MENNTTRIKFTKYGLGEDPKWLKVALPWKDGRTLLGDVIGYHLERMPHGGESFVLEVRHFNGEMWPIQPLASVVEVIR